MKKKHKGRSMDQTFRERLEQKNTLLTQELQSHLKFREQLRAKLVEVEQGIFRLEGALALVGELLQSANSPADDHVSDKALMEDF
jgi:hypothetical protein